MKVNELRIGNWVKYKDKYAKVENMSSGFIMDTSDYVGARYTGGWYTMSVNTAFKPIELTEEVLLKIGFEKDGNNYSLVCGDIEVGYYIDKFKQVLYINVSREKRFYKNELRSYDVKYLHQLQNTYYCLTNEELEVEL